ncbi:hypothetical protein DM860_000189 [Cuscuta australis]|uniref:HMA domain-containing protein n=1 Tax=Cuscuta australis TaxID=267555 RepID=A0A328CW04_9ASTE|nr:hypothetical protein DM860_000189 [Cuscuta australis]
MGKKKKNNSPREEEPSGEEKKNGGGVDGGGGGKGGADLSGNGKDKAEMRVAATTVLKMNLHCDGCLHKIYKIVRRTRGFMEMKVDRDKDHLTVTGVIDEKALAEALRRQMKRNVEIVPPKKEKGGGEKKENGGGEKGGGEKGTAAEGDKATSHNCSYTTICACGRGYQIHCNYPFAPTLFSDEEANACHVM